MARGGHRQGAGRKVGSKSTVRPKLREFINEREVKDIVETAKKKAGEGDTRMLTFILEQIFGRAVQPVGNDGDEVFKIAGVEISVRK